MDEKRCLHMFFETKSVASTTKLLPIDQRFWGKKRKQYGSVGVWPVVFSWNLGNLKAWNVLTKAQWGVGRVGECYVIT